MKNWKIAGIIATLIIVLIIPFSVVKHQRTKGSKTKNFEFVGASKCIDCHKNEFDLWSSSHHAHAMQVATDSNMLGDFNNAKLTDGSITHKFYKKDGKFYVYTVGPNGNMQEFEISHTFGYTPLQQYLVPFEKGKYQCLHIAWDTENQEWFNMSKMIYGEDIQHTDWLHWTNQAQNWNGMCAECHSTNLKKNYYHETDSFNTSFSEINVSCEACHGPGSEHLNWAWLPESSRPLNTNFGLKVQTSNINNTEYVELCARCHSRRAQVSDFNHDFKDIYDYMLPVTLAENYHHDGQILDEDYVFGSFLQSKMYHSDIKCNDCHNVHSGDRLLEGNDLCYQCHVPDYYGTKKHHFHKNPGESGTPLSIEGKMIEVGEGAQCINCHMPGQYYMGIDFRNDHSIRNPRPDLSLKIGTPNACNQCHTDKDAQWATNYFRKWYGEKYRPHYGEVFALAKKQLPEAERPLIRLINDTLSPIIVRATALELLGAYTTDSASFTIKTYIDDPVPLLRHTALRVFSSNNLEEYIGSIAPLLNDPHRTIRSQAAIRLSLLPEQQIPSTYLEFYKRAINEYKENNEYAADFPTARMNLGIMYANKGNLKQAKKHYKRAIEIDSAFNPAKVNLAMLHNRLGENSDAEKIYRKIIKDNPDFSGVYYSLGLLLAEEKRYEESIEYLEIASKNNPDNSRVFYNLALLYQQTGNFIKTEDNLKSALSILPNSFDYLYAICHFHANRGEFRKANTYGEKLKRLYPGNPDSSQLLDLIEKSLLLKHQ